MPSMKTNRSAAKRFKLSGNGKLIRNKANKSHILTKKPTKRTRRLRQGGYADVTKEKTIHKMIPYK